MFHKDRRERTRRRCASQIRNIYTYSVNYSIQTRVDIHRETDELSSGILTGHRTLASKKLMYSCRRLAEPAVIEISASWGISAIGDINSEGKERNLYSIISSFTHLLNASGVNIKPYTECNASFCSY